MSVSFDDAFAKIDFAESVSPKTIRESSRGVKGKRDP